MCLEKLQDCNDQPGKYLSESGNTISDNTCVTCTQIDNAAIVSCTTGDNSFVEECNTGYHTNENSTECMPDSCIQPENIKYDYFRIILGLF